MGKEADIDKSALTAHPRLSRPSAPQLGACMGGMNGAALHATAAALRVRGRRSC